VIARPRRRLQPDFRGHVNAQGYRGGQSLGPYQLLFSDGRSLAARRAGMSSMTQTPDAAVSAATRAMAPV
jgi:hypothetical protein